MRRFWFIVSLCLSLPLMAAPAFAEDRTPAAAPAKPAQGQGTTGGKTEIVTDEKAHAVRIFIDGKEIVTIDSTGLRVDGVVHYEPQPGLQPPHNPDKAP